MDILLDIAGSTLNSIYYTVNLYVLIFYLFFLNSTLIYKSSILFIAKFAHCYRSPAFWCESVHSRHSYDIDRSCTRGLSRTKIHLISPGCPQPSIALLGQNHSLKHQSYDIILFCDISQVNIVKIPKLYLF